MRAARMQYYRKQAKVLLRQLTLEQKVGQMILADHTTCSPRDVHDFHLGAVMSSAGSCPGDNQIEDWLTLQDALWSASTQREDALTAIPLLYGLDAIHGNANVSGATIFPHNIGLGATQCDADIERVAKVTADEVRAIGANWIFGPNLAIAQHYHWGRTYESVSEKPDVVARFADTYIRAMNKERLQYPILACAKHWVGDGATEYGIEQGDARMSLAELEQHMRPFIAAIDAGALSIMVSFSSWNGDKCHAHEFLVTEYLKQQLDYQGFVLSDMQGINFVDDDFYTAVGQSVNAGIDMFMMPQNWRIFRDHLLRHIELGTISMGRINDAVERILTAKVAMNLFEQQRPSCRSLTYRDKFGSAEHRQLARRVATDSCVLVKNNPGTLPISVHKRVLVTGKNANHAGSQCGGFTLEWQGVEDNRPLPGVTTLWQGIKDKFDTAQLVSEAQLSDVKGDDYDVAVVVVGERPYAEGLGDIRYSDRILIEAGSKIKGEVTIQPPYGRSLVLSELHSEDLATINTLKQKGMTVITVLITGRPLVIDAEYDASDALVVAWLPGSEGGAVADLLSGCADFTGRLSFSWPSLRPALENTGTQRFNKPAYYVVWPPGYGYGYQLTMPPDSAAMVAK
ncbi:glycoside hydrolase family 3 protein [Aestuariibacter salexigens]|uniref:glycoside hydrolase family 3 protein n=1 Tax=Aestuariibacter salexigens TaxID=226010 RepID=UPI0004174566|nr:glycoside hydrolase family 3 protein [Aestuariibacter salexigens]